MAGCGEFLRGCSCPLCIEEYMRHHANSCTLPPVRSPAQKLCLRMGHPPRLEDGQRCLCGDHKYRRVEIEPEFEDLS